MKKKAILIAIVFVFLVSVVWATNTTSTKNLIKFAADCSTYVAAGELCVDAANIPYVGDGLTALRVAQMSGAFTDGHVATFNSSGQVVDGGALSTDNFTSSFPGVVCKDSGGNITKCSNVTDVVYALPNANTTGTAGGLSGTPNITVNDVTAHNFTGSGKINSSVVGWVAVTGFTATPNSTSTLTVPDITSWATVGLPIKFAAGGTTYYAQITGLSSSLMTIAGAPFSDNVTSLEVGAPDRIAEMVLLVPGSYEASSSNTVLLTKNKQSLVWHKPEAAVVKYTVFSNTADTGSAGKVSVYINGNELNTSAGGLSIANAQTTYSTVVDIDAGNYTIAYGQPIEITATKGGNGDAADLTVHLLFAIK